MKFTDLINLKKTMNALAVFLGLNASEDDVPIDAQKQELKLEAEQLAKIQAQFGEEKTQNMIDAINKEIKAVLAKNLEFKSIQDEIDAIVAETNLTTEELQEALGNPGEGGNTETAAQLKAIRNKMKAQDEMIQKLIKSPDADTAEAVLVNMGHAIKHSATHLFGDGKIWNQLEGRAWNQRLISQSLKATDFNTGSNIPLLQDDLEHFVRENPEFLNSLFDDFEDLPKEWSYRSGVLDRISDGYIIPDEVVQGRKKGWAPKGDFHIEATEARMFRKKIDVSFDGYELQEMETTWIRMYNREGSSPLKMTFIGFLLSELVKQQMLDDRKAAINGIWVKTPDGDGISGKAVNSQDGLRYLFWYYRDVKKQYRAADIGVPTPANIVDYLKNLVESIPEDYRGMEMECGITEYWLKAYREKAGQLYNLQMNTEEGRTTYNKNYVVNYPNIKFQPLKDMTNTDFMYITPSKNIEKLDYNASEAGKFTITHDGKRNMNIFADYRKGIRIIYVGSKTKEGDPKAWEKQRVWSNNVPIFPANYTIPVFDDTTGEITLKYNNMVVDAAWKTDVTDVNGATPGHVVKITGNTSLVASKNVTDAGNITLTGGNFDLKSGGTLTLFVNADKSLKELSRTTAPATTATGTIEFTTGVIDANEGTEFVFTGGVTTAITSVSNGVEGKTITIYGTDTEDVDVTLSTTGNIVLTGAATLDTSADYINLTLVDGQWMETLRVIA